MYYVYKVQLDKYNAVYIGCTNDIRRRKDQHNENARKRKSFFGRFLNSCGVKLSEDDFAVIASYEERPQALSREKSEVEALIGTGVLVLNENYSDHYEKCGLCGKDNPISKTYVVVDIKSHKYEVVEEMHAWSESHGLSYKTLIGTAKRKPYVHRGRYVARYIEEWDRLSERDKEDLVSGNWYADHISANVARHVERMAKTYVVQTPSGETITVTNLDKFAHENGINAGNLHATMTSGKSACGYRVLERLS